MKRILSLLLLAGLALSLQVPQAPDESRFTKVVLDDDLNEPMELAVAEDGTLYYIERVGLVNSLDPKTGKKRRIAKLDVRVTGEDGLLGLALDPGFAKNRWLYLYYGDPVPRDGEYANVLARFELTATGLANRVELLRVPLLHEGVSHSAGSLAFDRAGNLYLSTGDNTNPFESEGYGPFDDRPGRLRFDALKSSGNTNDLRGKILRIKPQPDGTYTIPEGNLFPKGMAQTRPEIYVMGCRNPFRIALDRRTDILYWGEVGPDAGFDSLGRGPRGHDEINQARRAGNYGWPLFVGNNNPYNRYDFETKQSGEPFDPQRPVNNSRNNTGLQTLPPAQPALIWYPYADSPEFPELGTGGRNAMAGPVYYVDDYPAAAGKLPRYYDGRLFIYDWMRGTIFTVTLNQQGQYQRLERFLPNQEFNHPVDMAFGPRGELYLLEYGTYWRAKNPDAKLVRIDYNEGNRAPVARIAADKTAGAAPLTVRFSAQGSFDYDKSDSLRYEWFFTGNTVQGRGPSPSFTFRQPGTYSCRVRVTDPRGLRSEAKLNIRVGNEPPVVAVNWQGNRSFFAAPQTVTYALQVKDREDKQPDPARAQLRLHHLPEGEDLAGVMATGEVSLKGKTLMEQSDCRACHAQNAKSIGPSYGEIARRYDDRAVPRLAEKIINGGGGVWTSDHVMSAHPQLLKEDAAEMVRYILSLNKPNPQLPPKGTLSLDQPKGTYVLLARYTDKGGLMGQDLIRLRPTRFPAAEADVFQGVAPKNSGGSVTMSYNENGAWLCFRKLDLTGIKSIRTNIYSPKLVGTLEFRLNSPAGPVVAQVPVRGTDVEDTTVPLTATSGTHDVYVVYREQSGGINIWKRLDLRWLEVGLP